MTALSTTSRSVVARLPMSERRTWQQVDPPADQHAFTQGALALSYPLPAGLTADPRPTALVVVRHGARISPRASGPEAWAATFVQAVVEVIASDRPLTQLMRWTSRTVYSEIARRQQYVARHRAAPGVRPCRQQVATVRVSRPTTSAAEVAARVMFGARSRAVAARLDLVDERWLCTAISFG